QATKTINMIINYTGGEVTPENKVPTISASDVTLNVGDTFDPLKDVTANDAEDGDLTSKIKVTENTVDTAKAGEYKVVYEVTDSNDAKITMSIKVIVKEKVVVPDTNNNNNNSTNSNTNTADKEIPYTGGNNPINKILMGLLFVGIGIVIFRKRKSSINNL
ncbi:MAG: immunoglobulin-like domain-containing protein, partial [Clostridium sp.]